MATVYPKEYDEIVKEKRKIERAFRFVVLRATKLANGEELKEVAKLNLKGGPRDLSAKLNDYLYSE